MRRCLSRDFLCVEGDCFAADIVVPFASVVIVPIVSVVVAIPVISAVVAGSVVVAESSAFSDFVLVKLPFLLIPFKASAFSFQVSFFATVEAFAVGARSLLLFRLAVSGHCFVSGDECAWIVDCELRAHCLLSLLNGSQVAHASQCCTDVLLLVGYVGYEFSDILCWRHVVSECDGHVVQFAHVGQVLRWIGAGHLGVVQLDLSGGQLFQIVCWRVHCFEGFPDVLDVVAGLDVRNLVCFDAHGE